MNKDKALLAAQLAAQLRSGQMEGIIQRQSPKGPSGDWRAAYEQPDDDQARTNLRLGFLRAVRDHAPEVLADLAGEPLARYRPVQQFDRDNHLYQELELEADILHHPLFQPFWESLRAWGHRWNLVADWCLQRALLTLREWTWWPEDANQDDWGHMGILTLLAIAPQECCLVFGHWGWHPELTTWSAAEREIREDFEAYLATYREGMERLARERGLVPAPAKRTAEHYEWLVLYQVKGLSYYQIAQRACRERQTVTDGVKSTAALIGLPLRPPPPPGRLR